jgi:predicted aspartyl protease
MSESFDSRRGLIDLITTIEGPRGSVEARLVLDTGAALTAFRPRLFSAIGQDLADSRASIRIATASRIEVAPLHIVPGITALGHHARNIGVLRLDMPFDRRIDGLLGLNFLRGHQLLVDFRLGIVSLE